MGDQERMYFVIVIWLEVCSSMTTFLIERSMKSHDKNNKYPSKESIYMNTALGLGKCPKTRFNRNNLPSSFALLLQ